MAHVEKYTRTAVPHMVAHFERRKDENGNYIKFSNQNVDLTKTYMNYNLATPHEEGQAEFIRNRCIELNAAKRKDLNVMADWVITAPPSIVDSERTDEFFYKTYRFLANRYGKENVVSAFVHLDEISPHIHFAFVPVTKDGRISARDRINKTELSCFHRDLDSFIRSEFGSAYKGDLMTGIVKQNGGNKTVAELKAESSETKQALERIKPIKRHSGKVVLTEAAYQFCEQAVAQTTAAQTTKKRALKDVESLIKTHNSDNKHISALSTENQTLRQQNGHIKQRIDNFEEFTSLPSVQPLYIQFNAHKAKSKQFNK